MSIEIGIIGVGWCGGIRAIAAGDNPQVSKLHICDIKPDRLAEVHGLSKAHTKTLDYRDILNNPDVSLVMISTTPESTHYPICRDSLLAGKHVLIEKPLATNHADGARLVDRAEDLGLVLMCDHTYCYTPAVQELRRLVHSGALGEVQYVDSVRINLGLIRPDTDVVWDLAPHDLSILDYVLPPDLRPRAVAASGVDPVGAGRACVAYLSLPLGDQALGHLHVNWLSPTKVRTLILGGSERMVVWDDLQPSQRVTIYDRGVDLTASPEDRKRQLQVAYRTGNIVAPALAEAEALGGVVEELVSAVAERRPAATDGWAGLRVLALLEASDTSLASGGVPVRLADDRGRVAA